MSVISRKTKASHITSILKTPTIQSRLKSSSKIPEKVRFALPFVNKVRTILQNYLNKTNTRNYEDLVVLIRDSELYDQDISNLITESTECMSMLNTDLRLYVEALLSIQWSGRAAEVISEYQTFLLNLLSAHNYHTKYAIDKLVQQFLPSAILNNDSSSSDKENMKYLNIHFVFNTLLDIVPMSHEILFQSLVFHYPYLKKPAHVQEVYLQNLLWVLNYRPKFRPEILRLIFSKLIQLDVNAPKQEIEKLETDVDGDEMFDMDDDALKVGMKHPVAESLDISLDKLFIYLITECHEESTGELDWDKTKELYRDVISVFDQIILPTYNTHHVQFSVFLICCFKSSLTEAFLNYLWKKVCTPTVAAVLRQTAITYIASLMTRGTFVPLTMIKGTLQEMSVWIHSYINSQDGNEFFNTDVRLHSVFYSMCQALFYVIAFRPKDLFSTKKNITFLESLNLAKMVTCPLNPLRVCQPDIVKKFASVTRTYQLAYCYSVMEHNARNTLPTVYLDDKGSIVTSNNTLDAFFPFDPYILKRSGQRIWPFYAKFEEKDLTNQIVKENKDMEVDDFLCDNSEPSTPSKSVDRFSYGSSPGFKIRV